jgi:hypothetical protein
MATRKTNTAPDTATPEEINLLRSLERAERKIGRLVGAKEDALAEHNDGIKSAKADRKAVLAAIDDYRNGVRGLPLDE